MIRYHTINGEIVKIVDKEPAIISDIPVREKYYEAKMKDLAVLFDLLSGVLSSFSYINLW